MSIQEFLHKYLKQMAELQAKLLDFLGDEEDTNIKLQNLIKLFCGYDKNELKVILKLISKISQNHHRNPHFFDKIEQILRHVKDDIMKKYTNSEIFHIFKGNKRVLLILLENGIINIDQSIIDQITKEKYLQAKYPQYFSPEIEQVTGKKWVEELPSDFYEKRRIGENDSYLCQIIQKDLVDDFIVCYNKNNFTNTYLIENSIFETNSILLKTEKFKLIEYAAFCGSIRIVKYLKLNNHEITPFLNQFAVHSQNIELISFIDDESNHSDFDSYIIEPIKCHQNDVLNYFKDLYVD